MKVDDLLAATKPPENTKKGRKPTGRAKGAQRLPADLGKRDRAEIAALQESNERQLMQYRIFADHFCASYNAAESYTKAFGQVIGASVNGAKLLQNPVVREMILRDVKPMLDELGITKDYLIRRLFEESEASPLDYINQNGTLKTLEELQQMPRDLKRQVSGIELVEQQSSVAARMRWKGRYKQIMKGRDEDDAEVQGLLAELGPEPEPRYLGRVFLVDKQKSMALLAKITGLAADAPPPGISPLDFMSLLMAARERTQTNMKAIGQSIENSRSIKQLERNEYRIIEHGKDEKGSAKANEAPRSTAGAQLAPDSLPQPARAGAGGNGQAS